MLLYPGELYRLLGASSLAPNFGQKITNVAFVIADPLSKKIWVGVSLLM
jgi:hypothetical protein